MSMRRLEPRSLTNVFGTEQSSQAQDARTNPVATIHSGSQQRSSSPTPPEIAASPSPPSFMRDTALVRAARQMSDLRLYATSEQPRNANGASEQPRNDNGPWSPVPTSPKDNGGVITAPRPEHHISGDDVSYASNSSINFGLSPHDLFNRAHNEGQYHEYECHDDGNVERGFKFQLDAQSSHNSASGSRSIDDHG